MQVSGGCKYTIARRFWGHAPTKFLEIRGYEIASEMLLGGQTTEFYIHEYLPFLPVAPHIALVTGFRSFANLTSHTLRR